MRADCATRSFVSFEANKTNTGVIKTYQFAKELVEAGAARLGCSNSVAIMKESISSDIN